MKPDWIARQSGRPRGWMGEIVARVMSYETIRANRIALEQLKVGAGESVLEVGCGHGRTLAAIERKHRAGLVAGIDPSAVMVALASRRLRRAIAQGRADIQLAESSQIPYEDTSFDVALAVHVLYFWPNPMQDLREILRVLRPGGRLLLGYRPDDAAARAELPSAIYALYSTAEMEWLLSETGFDSVETQLHQLGKTPFACVQAEVPSAAGQGRGPAKPWPDRA
jgi:ubiquinone/menaquinone biosynthesis C-methylase UbiE